MVRVLLPSHGRRPCQRWRWVEVVKVGGGHEHGRKDQSKVEFAKAKESFHDKAINSFVAGLALSP